MDTAATLALLLYRVIDGADGRSDHETTSAILDEAACFAELHLAPLAAVSDTQGCRMVAPREDGGRPREAWRAFAEAVRLITLLGWAPAMPATPRPPRGRR
jgi:hypothetical protein